MVSLQHLKQLAIDAHRHTSFSPEKRGTDLIAGEERQLNEDIAYLTSLATCEYGREQLPALIASYQEKYESLLRVWLYAKGRCISAMIVGPSKFPTRRAEKANNIEDKRCREFIEWRERFLARAPRWLKPASTILSEIDEARKKMDERMHQQERMKEANKIIRKGEQVTERLMEMGFTKPQIAKLLTADFAGRIGFPDYKLTNNNAEVNRLRKRIAQLEAKQVKGRECDGEQVFAFEGGSVVLNYDIDRLHIMHDEKPEQTVIDQLKKSGFNWSRAGRCWQRKITADAKWKAAQITGVAFD
ncbi:hypothetical protein GCM10023189_43370 [Nibrella saemangeumensis]|uniref:Uncharacterized protein n=1 Tax=Nibrella saemangeumensis TaxID=1084526 RepID=A0ABP8NE09_9BACT